MIRGSRPSCWRRQPLSYNLRPPRLCLAVPRADTPDDLWVRRLQCAAASGVTSWCFVGSASACSNAASSFTLTRRMLSTCQDVNRRESHPVVQFTFLGYTFRPRRSVGRYGRVYVHFALAVSREALKAMRQTIRGWHVQLRTDRSVGPVHCGLARVARVLQSIPGFGDARRLAPHKRQPDKMADAQIQASEASARPSASPDHCRIRDGTVGQLFFDRARALRHDQRIRAATQALRVRKTGSARCLLKLSPESETAQTQSCAGSVTKPILRSPASCAAAIAWATRS